MQSGLLTNTEKRCTLATDYEGDCASPNGSSYGSSNGNDEDIDLSSDESSKIKDGKARILPARVSYRQQFADFSNVLKAFIGASLIGLPFAMRNSGIVLGAIGVIVIAAATDHCCHLIVKCKNHVISNLCSDLQDQGLDEFSIDVERNFMGKTLSFGDIGKHAMGTAGKIAVDISVFVTQFGFCIGYFVFLGNTIRQLLTDFLHKVPMAKLNGTTPIIPTTVPVFSSASVSALAANYGNWSQLPAHLPPAFSPQALLENNTGTFALLLLIPGPILILISFINNIRKLGPISVLANGAILTAFLATAVYIIAEFQTPHSTIRLFNWATFPVFFGQLTGAFEGIGTVIPIEGSMAENRRRYPCYLHVSLTLVSLMLASFGILGYLRYGEGISQIVTDNLAGSWMVSMLRILLFLGILFTYPLQIYPVIQLSEKWLFHSKRSCLYHKRQTGRSEATEQLIADKPLPRVRKVPRWKRNILRTFLVAITAAIGVVMRTQFAHVTALTGAVGSSLLSYILPCIFHLKLRKGHLPYFIIVKDISLIVFGIVGGTVGVTVTIMEIAKSL